MHIIWRHGTYNVIVKVFWICLLIYMSIWYFPGKNVARASSLCWASAFLKVGENCLDVCLVYLLLIFSEILFLSNKALQCTSQHSLALTSECLITPDRHVAWSFELKKTLLNWEIWCCVVFTLMKCLIYTCRLWRVFWRPLWATVYWPFWSSGVHLLPRIPIRPWAPPKPREALLSGWDLVQKYSKIILL